MKTQTLIATIVVAVLTTGTYVGARERHDKHHSKKAVHQTQCPIMQKNKIDKSLYYEHDGKRIYVCCAGCIKKVAENPAKYVKQLKTAGITLEKAQTTCPVMGGKIDKSLYYEHDGKRIYVCCAGCIGKIKAHPQKYVKKLQDAGVVLAHTPGKKHNEKKEGHGGHHGGHH